MPRGFAFRGTSNGKLRSVAELTVDFDERRIDAIFGELDQCHLPGAAVGIALDGRPVYRKGFGLANMELPVVLAPTTRLRIASITKHFAALAYLLLCESGQAAIDDPVGKYLPELHLIARGVSMRQLMGNISGLRDAIDIKFQFSGMEGNPVTSADLLALYRDIDDVNAAPGTAWIYNNGGWVMLSAAIERITRRSLEEVLRERIFDPVGMYDTLLRRWDSGFVPGSALGHVATSPGCYERAHPRVDYAGAGAMVSSVDDMLRWLAHMDAPVVGSPATWAVMKAPQRLANGTSTGYGLGLMTDRHRGIETLSHGGNWQGFNSQLLKVPAAGLDIVILVNRSDVSSVALAAKVIDACLAGLDAIEEASGPLAVGTFRSLVTGRVIQLSAGEGRQIASIDGMDIQVEADEEGVLWPVGLCSFMKVAIARLGDLANPDSLRLSDFGNADELVRVQPVDESVVGGLEGRYCCDPLGIEAMLFDTRDGPRLKTVSRFGAAEYGLHCLAAGIWRTNPASLPFLGGVLVFDADGGAFRYRACLTRGLLFRRRN